MQERYIRNLGPLTERNACCSGNAGYFWLGAADWEVTSWSTCFGRVWEKSLSVTGIGLSLAISTDNFWPTKQVWGGPRQKLRVRGLLG